MTGILSGAQGAFSALFWGLLLLTFLVLIHEAGHFVMARVNGVRVTEFFVGMPSRFRISRRSKRFGTEFGVTPLFLGGYNRICGLDATHDERAADVLSYVARHGRANASEISEDLGIEYGRTLDILIGLSDMASVMPYYDAEKGESPYQRTYPETWQTLPRDANGLTIFDGESDFDAPGCTGPGEPHGLPGGACEFFESERRHTFAGLGLGQKISILIAGVTVNLVFGMALFACTLSLIGVRSYVDEARVGTVWAESPAAEAGLMPDDVILSVDGQPTATWSEVSEALGNAYEARQTTLELERNGEPLELTLTMGEDDELFGVSAPEGLVTIPWSRSIPLSFSYVAETGATIAQLFIPAHTMEVLDNSSSVVGVSVMASQAINDGLSTYLLLVAAVSLSLGFMNLLPIPLLDGGKIIMELYCAIARRPVPKRVANAVSYVGLALLGCLFVYTLRGDILRIAAGL